MDLSIEAIAIEPSWRGLFTQGETDQAMTTLMEYSFVPRLEGPTVPTAEVKGRLSRSFPSLQSG